jgi:hypothetical protein
MLLQSIVHVSKLTVNASSNLITLSRRKLADVSTPELTNAHSNTFEYSTSSSEESTFV